MAIKLISNYSKKLGLPGYSSHSFGASVEVELTDLSQVDAEMQKLYHLLQLSVDKQMQTTGFVPDETYGINGHEQRPHSNGHNGNGNGNHKPQPQKSSFHDWNCTEGQKGFILRILNENNISKQDAEDLSNQLFGLGVKQINKMQASQLIEDLLVKAGQPARQNRWRKPQHANGS